MDTYEDLIPQPEQETQQPAELIPEEVVRPAEETPACEGPLQEEKLADSEPVCEEQVTQEPAEEVPAENEIAAEPVGKPKGHAKKVFFRVTAAILAVLFLGGCCMSSALLMNEFWKHQSNLLLKSFDERVAVLEKQLEEYRSEKNVEVVNPDGTLTPSQIFNQTIASVVAINCKIQYTENGMTQEGTAAGSGFVISEDGYVVTNHHVIENAISITAVNYKGVMMDAKLVGSDNINDIALLKIDGYTFTPCKIGSSSQLHVGDQVVAIGNALGELDFSLTVGYVSGLNRPVVTGGATKYMIQTDASINSGNSGGPLFNSMGEVVGINTAKYSGETSSGAYIEGIGFAIPMDDVIGMLDDFREYGYINSAYLGVMVQDVDAMSHQYYGVPLGAYVKSVTFGSAAFRAGIQEKDIILRVGGYKVECLTDLTRVLRNFRPGEEATITIWRSGEEKVLNITFDAKPQT